jgi:serine/threonine protein kinase/tetratricopeptide (TPR) repeat protein
MMERDSISIDSFTPVARDRAAGLSVDFLEARSLKHQLLEEQRADWEEGAPVQPEDLLPRWPTNPKVDNDFASILFEDYQRRLRRGEKPSVDEYSRRFPEHHDSLANLISRHDLLCSIGGASASKGPRLGLPEVGDEVFGFRLRGELGRGAFARVFLAEQANLADRPVVLKVSGIDGDEPYTLAQLQHTNVVPIYSVHEEMRAGLRALCMPYFGGASLSNVLRPLWAQPTPPREGKQLTGLLQAVQSPSLDALQQNKAASPARADGPTTPTVSVQTPLDQLNGRSYVAASAWIVARLAEGLQHAHQRGVLHRDIKPSNILLSGDGQPMLLDFNLAKNLHGPEAKAEATLGGTVAYMSPEHLRALANPSPAAARAVDHRSDIYSLGMVLFELLTGQSPFDQSASYSILPVMIEAMAVERSQAAPSVRKHQPHVPWSLESITRKCLAPDPAQRYQQAEHLAEDLICFLEDRPLKHAPELSRAERFQKWVRRHPSLTSSGSVAAISALILTTLFGALVGVHQHLSGAEHELAINQAREKKKNYQSGTLRALCMVNTVADLQDHLRQGLKTCEDTLAIYGVLDRSDWQQDSSWRLLERQDRERLSEDTRELLLLLAWARVRLAPRDEDMLRQALELLNRAEAIDGLAPSQAIWLDRARYWQKLGNQAEADAARNKASEIKPASARDHYLKATTMARNGDLSGAIQELTLALALNPAHYWSLVQRGICYQELGENMLAVADFATCAGLEPELPWGYFNKGYALDQVGLREAAIAAYTGALERDPEFLGAYVNRGLARLELKKAQEALADFDWALGHGRDDAFLHTGRGVALEALGRFEEADDVFKLALAKERTTPTTEGRRIPLVYGFAVSTRHPEIAREIFEKVLQSVAQQDVHYPQALYGLAMLALEQKQPQEAMKCFNRALEVHPSFVDARRYRAVLWARQGQLPQAEKDINWCLEKEPKGGATLYAAACVTSLASDRTQQASLAMAALDFLEKAFQRGYGADKASQDPDLAGLRKNPLFDLLLSKYAPPARGTGAP